MSGPPLKKGWGGQGNPPPGKQKCNVELRASSCMDPSGAAYIPKANSNSSNRIKAASRAFRTQNFLKDRNFDKRSTKKRNKQKSNLMMVEISPKSMNEEFLNSN